MKRQLRPVPDRFLDTARLVLASYRERLVRILETLNDGTPAAQDVARRATTDLVEQLNADLLSLYRRRERGTLDDSAADSLVPVLEKVRDLLRFRTVRKRPVADTLQRAVRELSTPHT